MSDELLLHESRGEGGVRFTITRTAGGYRAAWSGILELRVEDAAAPQVMRHGDAISVQKLEAGAVPALLGHLSGELHWHGAAVAFAGGPALVMLADAGTGKSTLAAALCERGAQFLGDDVVHLRAGARAPQCVRRERRHALRPDMAARLFGAEQGGKAVFDAARLLDEAPLGALVQLQSGPRSLLEPLAPRERVALLLRHLVRFALDDAERLRRDLDVCLALAEAVPMYTLVVPRTLDLHHEPLPALLGAELHGVLCPSR